jgi:hypothetical protein
MTKAGIEVILKMTETFGNDSCHSPISEFCKIYYASNMNGDATREL